jgi:hypothetical protein
MGVEFCAVLIPRDNTIRPDAAAILRLMTALRENHFAAGVLSVRTEPLKRTAKQIDDAELAHRQPGDFIAYWSVRDHIEEALTHPVSPEPLFDDEGSYYELEMHFSDDFVAMANECVDPIDERCECKNPLGYWPNLDDDVFTSGRIKRTCPRCERAFRPQDKEVIIHDGITGEEGKVMGGLTYRFAIAIDCGKSWPQESEQTPTLTPEFKRTCEGALGIPMYEVSYFY